MEAAPKEAKLEDEQQQASEDSPVLETEEVERKSTLHLFGAKSFQCVNSFFQTPTSKICSIDLFFLNDQTDRFFGLHHVEWKHLTFKLRITWHVSPFMFYLLLMFDEDHILLPCLNNIRLIFLYDNPDHGGCLNSI